MGKASRKRREQAESPPRGADAEPSPTASARRPLGWPAYLVVVLVVAGVVAAGLFLLREGGDDAGAGGSATSPTPPIPVEVGEVEPNDVSATAQPLASLPARITAALGAGDRDFYAVDLAPGAPHSVDVVLSGSPGLRVWLSRDGAAAKVTGGVGAPLLDVGLAPGQLFVAVDGGDDGATGAYELDVTSARWRLGREFEPNGDADSAGQLARLPARVQPTPHGSGLPARTINRLQVRARFAHAADVDCFSVPLEVPPTGAVLRIELSPAAESRAELGVEDDQGTTLARVSAGAAGETLVVPALGARSWEAAYVVCARAASERWAGGQEYRLLVDTLAPTDPIEFEPNDASAVASALPPATPVVGYLTRDDVDWFRISAAPEPEIAVSVKPPDGVDCELALIDDQGGELARVRTRGGQEARAVATRPAFARLRALSGSNLVDRYSLRVDPAEEARP